MKSKICLLITSVGNEGFFCFFFFVKAGGKGEELLSNFTMSLVGN